MKLFNKLTFSVALVTVCASSLVGCGDNGVDSSKEKVLVRISTNQIESHPDTLALGVFKEEVEKKLGDKFQIQIYPNATLGANEKVLELIKQGSVQFLVLSTANVESFDPVYAIFSMPYLFTSQDNYEAFIQKKDVIDQLNVNAKKTGFTTLAAFTAGTRNFYTRKPVKTVDDLNGLKIRVQAGPTNVAMVEAFGAAATPMSYGDVYSALQQSVIDGAENSELALTDMKHGEVCKYFTYDMHQMCPDVFVGSTKFLDGLSSEERSVFEEAAKVAQQAEFKLWHDHTAEAIDKAKNEMGVTFINVDVNSFREKVLPIHEQLLKNNPVIKELYEQIDEVNKKGI